LPRSMHPYNAILAVMMHFKIREKLLSVYQYKKDITDRVQQPKSHVQRVKQEVVVVQVVKIVTKDGFRDCRVRSFVANAPLGGEIPQMALQVAMPSLQDRTANLEIF
jgi:hypothetical protein